MRSPYGSGCRSGMPMASSMPYGRSLPSRPLNARKRCDRSGHVCGSDAVLARNRFVDLRRREHWPDGIAHREWLVHEVMHRCGLKTRPFVKDIIDEAITDVQEARLREDVLPLDRYGQTEVIEGRVE